PQRASGASCGKRGSAKATFGSGGTTDSRFGTENAPRCSREAPTGKPPTSFTSSSGVPTLGKELMAAAKRRRRRASGRNPAKVAAGGGDAAKNARTPPRTPSGPDTRRLQLELDIHRE